MKAQDKQGKSKMGNKRKLVLIIVAAVLIWAAVLVFILLNYVFIGGKLISRNADALDFSGRNVRISKIVKFNSPENINLLNCDVTVQEFCYLKDAFPDCYIRWSVPLSSGSCDSESKELRISSITEADLELFTFFNSLERVAADGVPDWEILYELESRYPDIELDWGIEISGKYYSSDIEELRLNEDLDYNELYEKLKAFSNLKTVYVQGNSLEIDEQLSIVEKYPDLAFHWIVMLTSDGVSNDSEKLDFSGMRRIDLNDLTKCAPLLPNIKEIDFTGCSYKNTEMKKVADAYPDADVIWQFSVYGQEISSLAEEVDFSGIAVEDTSEIENALPYLKNLKKVIMSDCGIPDEEMDALNKKYDDVRFIWTVYFGRYYYLRTDATVFIASLFRGYAENPADLTDENIVPLKYCIDMEALDLGHMYFSNVDFCSEMRNLKWLIIAMSRVNDISGLANCTELFYLEMFLCPVHDLSPLLNCKKLRHLNICQCETEESLDILAQMTWLERCWMSGGGTFDDKEDRDYVRSDEFLPHTMKRWRGLDHTGDGWRNYPTYFEMRDVFDAPYYPTFWSSNFWRNNPNVIVPEGFIEEHGLEDFDDHSMNWK